MRAAKRSKIRGTANIAVGACDARSSASCATPRAIRHLRAERERQVVAAGALEHVRQRQDRQEPVVRRAPCRSRGSARRWRGCCRATASRPSGRPAVPDVKQIVASVSSGDARGPRTSPPAAGRKRSAAVVAALAVRPARSTTIARQRVLGAASLRKPSRDARSSRRRASRASACADAPRDVVGIVVDVERHDDEPEAQRGQVDRDPVDAVARAQRDAVAGARSPRAGTPPASARRARATSPAVTSRHALAGRSAGRAPRRVARGAARRSARCWRPCGVAPAHRGRRPILPHVRAPCARLPAARCAWLYSRRTEDAPWPRSRSPRSTT